MKKKQWLLLVIFSVFSNVKAQNKWYVTSNYEIVFSSAQTQYGNYEPNDVVRFSPFYNVQTEYNLDFRGKIGLLTGFGIRNVGFIYDVPVKGIVEGVEANQFSSVYSVNSEIRKKFRCYTLGFPIGIKLGNLNRSYFFAGYEIEIPFHYKEKTFVDGDKEYKHSNWFDRVIPSFYHTAFAGFQLPGGAIIKFKYYFTDFFKQELVQATSSVDSAEKLNWSEKKNFYPTKVNLFTMSLTFRIFNNKNTSYNEQFENTFFTMNE